MNGGSLRPYMVLHDTVRELSAPYLPLKSKREKVLDL